MGGFGEDVSDACAVDRLAVTVVELRISDPNNPHHRRFLRRVARPGDAQGLRVRGIGIPSWHIVGRVGGDAVGVVSRVSSLLVY